MAKKKLIEYFQPYSKNIIIPFESYYGLQFEDYNEFFLSIASKKTYSKISALIIKENNIILNLNDDIANEFLYKYFTLKYSIDNGEAKTKTPETFIVEMITSLFTPSLVKLIVDYVDSKYNTDIDQNIDLTKHKYDVGTTFLDRHYKMLYQVSCMSRLIIPLLTHYIYNERSLDTNKFIMDTFGSLFKIVETGTDIDIYAKLHLFVSRAIQRTLYTDAVMWDRLRILGVTPEIVCEDTMNKLITNVIPKYSFDMNIMNLNTVVIRKSVMSYTLRKRDPYTLYSLSSNDGQASDEDSIISETEIFDSYNTQRDESIILFRKFGTGRDIDIIQKREAVLITPEEIEFYSRSKRYHEFQKTAICFVFSRYFSGVENIIGGCRKEDWIRLIIILKKMLERMGLNYLSDFISAERQQYSYKRISKFLDNTINDDPLYKEIIEKRYKSIGGIFEKKNFIKAMIVILINNTYTYNSFGDTRNGWYIEKNELKIVKEVLTFFNTLIL